MLTRYSERVEFRMRNFYESLSEKDRRRYAAVEAEKIGYGGISYISELFGCDPKTIQSGIDDIDHLPADPAKHRIRKKGRKKKS